ncbi:MAG: peptidyl-prolyl cis-trans isomerase [Thermoanaerobaculia bacterium]|nr:peptidyl-prolyl cis-trans isomerase [Thermoanaerobaculia bacterium]
MNRNQTNGSRPGSPRHESARALSQRSLLSLAGAVWWIAWTISCSGPPSTEPAREVAATYDGGQITLADIEEELRRSPASNNVRSDNFVPLYRQAAENILVRRLAQAADDTAATSLPPDLARRWDDARKSVLREELLRTLELPATLEISNVELRAEYDENQELFARAEQRNVWHIFRRAVDEADAVQVRQLLEEQTQNISSPAEFSTLARKISESETRSLEGRLGWIQRGRLPSRLEQVVFSLDPGSTSEPLAVPGGWTVFFVSDVLPAHQFTFEDVVGALRQRAFQKQRRDLQLQALGDPSSPTDAVEMPRKVVLAQVMSQSPQVLLQIGDRRVTGSEFAARLAQEGPPQNSLPPAWRIEELYDNERFLGLLDIEVAQRKLAADPVVGERVRQSLADLSRSLRTDAQIVRWLREQAATSPNLFEFFEDNRFLYQSELERHLIVWSIPLTGLSSEAAAELTQRVDKASERLDSQRPGLDQLVREVGGSLEDLGWVKASQMASLAPKVLQYVTQVSGTGMTDPFQLSQSLCLVAVKERREPSELPFEDVEERVVSDYLERSKQSLYADLVDRLTGEANFTFFPENVAAALAPPTDSLLSSPPVQNLDPDDDSTH